jgi:type IV pilus assembly protein PilM
MGLDVGTHAVTVAGLSPGSPARLELFGQVTLARDAMREGEVVDDAAVTDAVARLRDQLNLRRTPVRVGIASPRLIVRQVEMPAMSHAELAGALRYQATDLIPIPIDEAAMDFVILGTDTNADGESVMRVLLAAAQRASVTRLVDAVEAASLPVIAVDLLPVALIRALASPFAGDDGGAEGIVSFGGGVTSIAVHDSGVPRFVRVLGTGGRELTDAIAAALDIPAETAESLKRQLAAPQAVRDELIERAAQAVQRPLSMLLDDVRSSIDYYRNQPGAARLARVVVTGGASQLPGIAQRLETLLGIPVEPARPRDLVQIGDIGFSEADYPRLDPNLPGAVGLALGGLGVGTALDLLSRSRRKAVPERSRLVAVGAAAAAGLLVVLGLPTMMQRSELSDAKGERSELQAENASLQSDIGELADEEAQAQKVVALGAQVTTVLENDVSWTGLIEEISRAIPANVWLTSFQGGVTAAAPTKANAATTPPNGEKDASSTDASSPDAPGTVVLPLGGVQGTVTWQASGESFDAIVAWIKQVSASDSFTGLWVPDATRAGDDAGNVVDFSSTAELTDHARSDRAADYLGGQK